MSKLHNTLVDACVVIGLNENVELLPPSGGFPLRREGSDKEGPYKQFVLAVFTEDVAYFPESRTKIEGEPFYDDWQVLCPAALSPEQEDGVSPSSGHSKAYSGKAESALPFSTEVVQSLPTFCFPSGGYIFKENQPPKMSYLVLTNMEGERTYAVCVTVTRRMTIEGIGKTEILHSTGEEYKSDNSFVYVPICICLVSSYPYLETLRHCLSALLPYINESTSEFWRPFMKLSTIVTTVPVPPAGLLAIKFNLFDIQYTIYPADEADRRVIDLDLHLPLLIFSPECIIKMVVCLLTQQRLVFMSSSYALLTLIIETLLTYIDPIKWRLTYVPVLPDCLGDLMEAPGPFIMGVHSSLKSQVKEVRKQPETPSIVLVDIDKGELDYGEGCHVPQMPDIVFQSLRVRLKRALPHYELKLVSLPAMFSYEECQEQRLQLQASVSAEIKDAFLDMLVSLFGDIFNYMSVGERFFDKDAYLASRHEDERAFFIEVLATDAFIRFVEERLENHERRDAFAVLGERIAAQRKSPARSRTSTVLHNLKFTDILPIFKRKTETFRLPAMQPEESLRSGSFYQIYRECLSQQLACIDNKSIQLKASFLYLRGFANIACNDPIAGLRDFHALYASAPELYPKEYAADLVNKLDQDDLNNLQNESFYKQSATSRTFTSKESLRRKQNRSLLPTGPVDKLDFEKRVKTLKIALHSDLIDWLFDILSDDGVVVLPEEVATLYKDYTETERKSEIREISGVTIKTNDRILHVSSLINTMNGTGRLVLTTNMLYFVGDGMREYVLVTPVCDIKEIIKYQHSSVFWSGVHSLRIINSDRNIPPFYACLKNERDTWLLFLNELAAGHRASIAMRDPKMVDIAVNNIMLARTFLQRNVGVKIVEGACSFLRKQSESIEGLSEDTKELLIMCLNPCVREAKRTTVMCITYVPGNTALNESPSVWCGMGSGAIMVYETDKWYCVSELRYAKNRVSCLLLVGDSQIWAGSYDSVIYVINTETRKSEQQLQNHTSFVSDIISQGKTDAYGEKKTLVWSSSYNGQIVCWDRETRQAINSFILKRVKTLSQIILVSETNLWCVAGDKILIVDISTKDCPILQKLIVYDEYQMPILLEYALKISPTIIWVSAKTREALYVWDTEKLEHECVTLAENIRIYCMVYCSGSVWVGNKDGKVFLMSPETNTIDHELHAHTDVVKSMCVTKEGHVITGSSSKEGKVCVWSSTMGFEVIDGKRRCVNKRIAEDIKKKYEIVSCNFPTDDNHYM